MEQDITESPTLFNAWAWVEKNQKHVIRAAAVIAVVGLVIGYMAWARGEKERAAGVALSQALYNSSVGRIPAAEAGTTLLKVASDNAGTRGGTQALLLAGGALFNGGKYAEAQAAFERFTREQGSNPLVAQAIYGTAAAQAAQGKSAEAVTTYKSAVDRFPNAPIANQARFALAGVLAEQGNLEQAVSLYGEVARVAAGNSLGNEAALRADELSIKLPMVPAVVSTNAVSAMP